jgi:hypothetical protein
MPIVGHVSTVRRVMEIWRHCFNMGIMAGVLGIFVLAILGCYTLLVNNIPQGQILALLDCTLYVYNVGFKA